MTMLETMLAAKHTFEIPVMVYSAGVLSYRISAERPVDSYVVDAANRQLFLAGRPDFTSWATIHGETLHSFRIAIAYVGQWFVLVGNPGSLPARVQADIQFIPSPTPTGYGGPTGPTGPAGLSGRGSFG